MQGVAGGRGCKGCRASHLCVVQIAADRVDEADAADPLLPAVLAVARGSHGRVRRAEGMTHDHSAVDAVRGKDLVDDLGEAVGVGRLVWEEAL